MTAQKISAEEIKDLKISSLPTHPNSPRAYGGKGYTANEMKEAFDKLPLFIIARLNALLDDISREGEGSVAENIKTGIKDSHTLARLFSDIKSGEMSSYLAVGKTSLAEALSSLKAKEVEYEAKISDIEGEISKIKSDISAINELFNLYEEFAIELVNILVEHEDRLCALEGEESDEQDQI